MKRRDPALDPELEAFLEPRRIERQAPPELRARVLARARAIAGAGEPLARSRARELPTPQARSGARGGRLFRIALAASIAVAAAAVGAVAALQGRSAGVPRTAAPAGPAPVARAAVTSLARPPNEAPVTPPRPALTAAKRDPFRAELDLLQRAQAAYTRHDFSVALALVAEHAKRFPGGHLAEQREALRVRSLVDAGRADEAHRAAAAFAVRFPRSVLLPRVAGGAESAPP